MDKLKIMMDKILAGVCATLLAFMTVLATYQVITRYVFKSPSTISEDLLSYSFVWVSLLGTALVFGQKDHMRLSLFSDKLKGIKQLVLSISSELLVAAIAVIVFLVGGKEFMGVGAMQISPTLDIQMHWIYIILPLSGVLIVIYNFINIFQLIQGYNGSSKGEMQ
ncbi:TRAP transporter small permease [Sporosarcina sp. JAI121]|uniref:TRAP transporter small permease n=1 Tax=Sporosarcina sp. JAI121 TaxID=2723064 RepID=UPI0015C8CD5D|nr:TRAP transporter small permease [Sporosarcina sp. JAI121]NYF25631.1 TRAP-type C4-dicarboxylate transport system permease small subunit [Sporosarcina sp. JAI121]